MSAYRNEMEGFYADRVARQKAGYRFANQLIIELDARNTFQIGGADIKMLDYEIYPLRTTKSVRENGKSARSKVSGTMDALFAVSRNGVTCPGIGEIKAKSEQVGVTFALVQALMNASLLMSPSQFRRLKNQKRYVESFADLSCESPVVDIVLLMEKDAERIDEDVALATQLRDDLQTALNDCIRSITFAEVDEHYQVQMFK
ncbi:MAG TPA: hypothetical protein DDZ51_29945 [Planctomycetaceae bacterium]|nr:hypothetical protein [Planctomycetaceae bacterium]